MDPTQMGGGAPTPQAAPVQTPPATPAPVAQPAPAAQPADTKPVEGVPADSRERTREQFEKLLESNRRLYEANDLLRKEMETRRTANQTFAPLQGNPQMPQQQPEAINPADFVDRDPVTGEQFINEGKLRARLEDINQRASRAEQAIQSYMKTSEEREIERQNKEAFTAYPDLQPGAEKFNSVFHRQVRGVLYDSMLNADDYGGRPLSFKEAADFVRAQSTPQAAQPAAPQGQPTADAQQQQAQAAQALKEQSSAQVMSQPQNAPPQFEPEDLKQARLRTRYGDDETLARRLLNTDHLASELQRRGGAQ